MISSPKLDLFSPKIGSFCDQIVLLLCCVDTVIQENHQRVNIFFDYAKKTKNTAWSYFLPMLNRQDLFTVHMVSSKLIVIEAECSPCAVVKNITQCRT